MDNATVIVDNRLTLRNVLRKAKSVRMFYFVLVISGWVVKVLEVRTVAERKIQIEGGHTIRRRRGADLKMLSQEFKAEITPEHATYALINSVEGFEIPVHFTDPAEIAALMKIDRLQDNFDILSTELPDPIRLPFGQQKSLPNGFRLCWVCKGWGNAEDEFGAHNECVNCEGQGYLPNAPAD